MSVKIGDNNKIVNSIITDKSTNKIIGRPENWLQRHPILVGVITTLIAALILSLSFWDEFTSFINKLIGG